MLFGHISLIYGRQEIFWCLATARYDRWGSEDIVKTKPRLFYFGLVIYLASFFLVGAGGPGQAPPSHGSRGYFLAWWALLIPWINIDLWTKGLGPILMPATAVSGLINPIFISGVFTLVVGYRRAFAVLRVIVLSMMPFCWPLFFMGFRPREGYFVWTLGILLVLFSTSLERPAISSSPFKMTVAKQQR